MEQAEKLEALAHKMIIEFNSLEVQRPEARPDRTQEDNIKSNRILASMQKILQWLTANKVICKTDVTKTQYKTYMFIKFEGFAEEDKPGGLIF